MTAPSEERVEISSESMVSFRVVRALVDRVEQAGVARGLFLDAAQLAPERFEDADARLPRSKVYELCELAMDLTDDPALGLHWAETMTEGTFVPISHLIAHAATLRQGFRALARFHLLLTDQPSFQIIEMEDRITVRGVRLSGASPRMQRFSSEMMVAGFFRLLRKVRLNARAKRVSFEHAAPPYHAEYARVFADTVRFDQPFTGIVFEPALLDMPAPHNDADVHDALEALAQRRLLRMTQRTPYALRVRELLVQQPTPLRTDMRTIARLLDLSVRSLRRRLAEEGKSYNDVSDEALGIVAKHLLRDKQRTIQETAFEMGFSDTSTFHRAFKRWTGTTPRSYRQVERMDDEAG